MGTQNKKDKSDALGNFMILLLIVVLVFFSPGILIIGLANTKLSLTFDLGQLWTFAIMAAIAIYALISVIRKSAKQGLKTYVLLCIAIIAIALISDFGFKAEWPALVVAGFFPA